MLILEQLTMTYALEEERVDVLKGIDLSIDAGESVAVVGPSGSGKTTLLLLLAGLDKPSSGSIRLDGVILNDCDSDTLADLRRDRLGIVFQSFHLVPSLTAIDNVSLPLEIAGRRDARARARDMLEAVGLEHRHRHYPSQLSGGEQQRVAIARALVHSPALLLADEPTGNLDQHTGAMVGDILFDLHSKVGSTMIMATHDTRMAERCDRLLFLDDGHLRERTRDALRA